MPALAAPSGPDLVAAVSGGAPALSGGTARFVVSVRNVGAVASSGRVAVQLTATGNTDAALSTSGGGWSCTESSGFTGECANEATIAPGGESSNITVSVPAGEALDGAAGLQVVISNSSDSITADDSASVEEPVVASSGIDLAPAVLAGPPVAAGASATFQVGVQNLGGTASAGNVEVVIASQGDVAGEWSASGSGWSCPAGAGRCTTSASVPAGATLPTLSVHVPADSSFPTSRWVGLSAQVVAASDAITLNDAASAQVPLGPPSGVDLEVATHGEGPVPAGAEASFSTAVRNVGDAASSGQIELRLAPQGSAPNGTVSASGEGWSCTNTSMVCDYDGVIPAGNTAPVVHVRLSTAGAAYPSSAGLSAAVSGGGDGVVGDESGSTQVPVVPSSGADLAVGVAGAGSVVAGGEGVFHITVANVGGAASSGQVEVALSSFGDAESEWSGSGTGWACPAGSKRCVHVGVVAAGEALPDLTVSVPTGAGPFGRETVGLDAQVINVSDGIESDDTGVAEIPVTQLAQPVDLVVDLSRLGPLDQGQAGSVTAVVSNVGSESSSGPVTVQLGAPPSIDATASGSGWTCTSTLVCAHASPVAAGGSLPPITLGFKAPAQGAVGDYHISARVSNESDADTANNEIEVEGAVGGVPVNLNVTLSGLEPLTAGENDSFTATVTNSGTSASTGPVTVRLKAPFPGASASGSGWTCTSTLVCSNPNPVNPGANLPALTTTFTTPVEGVLLGAEASASVTNESNAVVNRESSISTAVGGFPVDLVVGLSAAPTLAQDQQGSVIATVRNMSGIASTGPVTVRFSPPFPGASASGSGWTCSSKLACTTSTPVPPDGGLPALTLTFTPAAHDSVGQYNLSATVSNASDSDQSNDQTSANGDVGGIPTDVTMALTSAGPLQAGSLASFTARVANSGTRSADGPISVQLHAPYVGAVVSGEGWVCSSTLACTNQGPVGPGAGLPDLTLKAPIPAESQPGETIVSGTVSAQSDTNTINNATNLTVPVVTRSGSGGLHVDLSASSMTPEPGEVLDLQASIDNLTSHDLPGPITVKLIPSFGLVLQSAEAVGWSCDHSYTCTLPVGLNSGETQSLNMQAQVAPGTTGRVYLSATASDGESSSPAGVQTLPLTVLGTGPDLAPRVSPLQSSGQAGENATFQVTVGNFGSSASSGPIEVVLMPQGSDLGGWTASGTGWSCPRQADRCTYEGIVAPGGAPPALSASVPIEDTFPAAPTILEAQVINASDGVSADNSSKAEIPVVASSEADLVTTISNTGAATAGRAASFHVAVSNVGASADSGPVEVQMSPGGDLSGRWSASGSGWGCASEDDRCVYTGPAAAGATLPQLTVSVPTSAEFPGATSVFLTTKVSNSSDGVAGNDSASSTVPIVQASATDLSVGVIGAGPVPAGGHATFHVDAHNVGGAASSGPVEVALSPTGDVTQLLEASGSGWLCPTAERCVTLASVSPGESLSDLIVSGTVAGESERGPSSAGLSAVVFGGGDGVVGDESASAQVPVVPSSGTDLAVGVAGAGSVVAGGEGVFHVTVANVGEAASSGQVEVELSSFGEAGREWSGSGVGWVCPAGSERCVYAGAVGGGEELPDLTVSVPIETGFGRETAGLDARVINASDGVEHDNSGAAEIPITQLAQPVDLVVGLSHLGPLRQGQTGSVTAVVSNGGSAPSSGPVTVQLSAPSLSNETAGGSGWTCTSTLACTHASPVTAGGSLPPITLSFNTPTRDALGEYHVSAQVSSSSDADTTNNETEVEGAVGGVPVDLNVTLSGLVPFTAGENGSFTATVTNSGTSASTGPVTVRLHAPFSGASASGSGWTCTSTLVCSNTSPVNPGTSLPALTTTFITPSQNSVGESSASALVEGGADALTSNDAAELNFGTGEGSVDLTSTLVDTTDLRPGQSATATVQVANSGTQASSGRTTVRLNAPAGAGAAGHGWTCTSALECTNTTPVGAGGNLPDITATFTPSPGEGPGTSSLSASLANSTDSDTRNDSSSLTSGIGGVPVDLALSLMPSTPAQAGSQAAFLAHVTNAGTSPSSGPVSVQLEATYEGASASGSGWTCTSTLACSDPGPVEPGTGLPDITLTMPVPAAQRPGETTVSGTLSNDSDANTTNNSASVGVPVTNPSTTTTTSSSYFSIQPLIPRATPGGDEELQVQLNGVEPMADQPATVTLTLPTGVSYKPHSVTPSTLGEPAIGAGGSQLSWNVTYPSNGTTTTFRFAVSISGSAAPGARTVSGGMSSFALASEQTGTTTFEVANPFVEAVSPKAIGQAPHVTVEFAGTLLNEADTYELTNTTKTIEAEAAEGNGNAINATFNTSSLPPGEYEPKVITNSGQQLTGPEPITVGGGGTPNLSVGLNGPTNVHLNSTGNYYATVTNTGDVDLFDVPVIFSAPTGVTATAVEPNAKTLLTEAIEAMTSTSPGPGQLTPEEAKQVESDIQAEVPAAIKDPSGEKQYLFAYIPEIPAGATATTEFQVHPTSYVTGNVAATVPTDSQYLAATDRVTNVDQAITAPLFGKSTAGTTDASGSICQQYDIPSDACTATEQTNNSLNAIQHFTQNHLCMSFSDITQGVIGDNCQFDPLGLFKSVLKGKFPIISQVVGVYELIKELFDLGDQVTQSSSVSLGVTSYDPNDLVGPQGYGPEHYISPKAPMSYQIVFENLPTATAPAQRVTIVDPLPHEIDPATVRIPSAEVDGVQIPLEEAPGGPGVRTVRGTAVLEPISGRSVTVEATIEEATGQVTIHLAGPPNLDDPFTPSPYANFLPQNTTPPEGEGSIRLEGALRGGLSTGTVVSDKASVTFDDDLGGTPQETPTAMNTIDATPPTATITPLPAEASEAVTLQWNASDLGSGVSGVDIFESTDGKPLTEIAAGQGGSSMAIPVSAGHAYSFAVRPIDNAGNVGNLVSSNATKAVEPPSGGPHEVGGSGGGSENPGGSGQPQETPTATPGGGGVSGGQGSGGTGGGVQGLSSAGAPASQLAGGASIKGITVSVPVRCPATSGTCRAVSVVLSVIENIHDGHIVGLAAQKHRSVVKRKAVLASATVMLAAGQTKTLKLTLDAAGRKLLAHYKKFAAEIEFVASGHTVGMQRVTLRNDQSHGLRGRQ